MSKLTENLGLFCWEPESDAEQEFDINKSLNENWKKIDKNCSNYANAIKQRVEQTKEAQIQSASVVLQDVNVYGESVQEGEPSVNNPVNIISAGSNKNFLDLEDVSETTTAKGITYSIKNGIFTLNGTSTGSHYITFSKTFNLPKGTYTYSTTVVSGELGGTANLGKQLNNGSELLFNAGNILDIATTTITEDANEVKCSFYVGSSVVFNNFKVKLKLEEGNKVTGYTNYNCGGIDYKTTSKNKLDLNKITLSSNTILNYTGITIKKLWGTPILSNQKILEMLKPNTNYICTAKVKVVNKPVILSSSYNHNRILLLNKTGGTNIEVLSSNQKNSLNVEETHELKIEFTTPQDLVGYRLLAYTYFGKNDEGSADAASGEFEITDLMIREANIKDDAFELYKEITETIQLPLNTELCKIGDYQDCIDSSGVIHKRTKKIVLSGTENWYSYANYTGEGYCYYLEDSSFPLLSINNQKYKHSISTHFKNVYAVWSNNSGIGTYSDHATVHRKYFISDKATLAEFKAWLAQETPELIYVLAEEDTTQSLADAEKEKLQNLKTFAGINNITTNAPTSFTYNLDANNLLDRIALLEEKIAELQESGVLE